MASFLWQASAHYAPELRRELMAVYLDAARLYTDVDEGRFRERMRLFVLFRTLQVLGHTVSGGTSNGRSISWTASPRPYGICASGSRRASVLILIYMTC